MQVHGIYTQLRVYLILANSTSIAPRTAIAIKTPEVSPTIIVRWQYLSFFQMWLQLASLRTLPSADRRPACTHNACMSSPRPLSNESSLHTKDVKHESATGCLAWYPAIFALLVLPRSIGRLKLQSCPVFQCSEQRRCSTYT